MANVDGPSDRPDPSTLEVFALDRAEVELERQYRVPSHVIAERDAPEHVPPDVRRGGVPLTSDAAD